MGWVGIIGGQSRRRGVRRVNGDQVLTTERAIGRTFTHRLLVDNQRAAPLIIFLLVLAITAVSVVSIERGERERDTAELSRVALAAASALERRASVNASYLRAGAALFMLKPQFDEAEFRRFAAELQFDTDARGAQGLGWAPAIPAADASAFMAQLSRSTGRPVALRPALSAQSRQLVVPVSFLEPDSDRNRKAVGFDMFSDPTRRAAMQESERTGSPTASGKVVLTQDSDTGRAGFLIYMPVFDGDGSDRRLRGFVYSPFNAGEFLRAAGEADALQGMRLSLFDGEPSEASLMGRIGGVGDAKGQIVRQQLRVVNRSMILEAASLETASLSTVSMLALMFGLAVASLLMLVARLLTKQLIEDQRALSWFAEQNSIRNSLTRELNHRVKNTLANVLSIVTLTRRRAKTLDEFADGLDGRIRALSATHDLLTQSDWGTTPIEAVAAAELAPYTRSEDGVLDMTGPAVELAPNDALSLGLTLHELATNASKYGALSVPGGRVTIRWSLAEENLARVEWIERGGPPVAAKRPRGFGTDLIEKIVAHELRNPVDLIFAPEGVRCTLMVPVRQPVDFTLRSLQRTVTGH